MEEIDQREPLAIGARGNSTFVRLDGGRCDPAGRADWLTQIRTIEVFANAFERHKVKRFVFTEWATDRRAVLLAMKILEWFAVRSVRRQRFETLKIEATAVNIVCA